MPLQARAEATRRKILDSAVELFSDLGYGETGLADILLRAGVSKGAFYYHFDSKEAVATAIIEDYCRRNAETVSDRIDPSLPLLGRVMVASFASAEIVRSDTACRIGNELLQALGQVSSAASRIYTEWTRQFTSALTMGLEAAGVREGVNAREAAEAMWAGVLGCHLLSSALDDHPHDRLAGAWASMIRAVLPENAGGVYHDLLDRTVNRLPSAVG